MVKLEPRFVLIDWGDTLMSEDGPGDIPMAQWPTLRVLPGVETTLRVLSQRYRLGIATNATISSRDDIERALERAGLSSYFSEIFSRKELGCSKATPLFWATILENLSLKPQDVVMIGDSLDFDVRAARRAGLAAIWFNWKGEKSAPFEMVLEVRRFEEILPLLL